ncbi:50S ribosomal protein L21 [Candidatus Uhrbacteria bacterium]|nr:50S ribosomal protein L21 [Candidatus Uhrbacteria bacterium]
MIAVIKTGGKQYIVQAGTILKVEKLPGNQGDQAVFDQVLLMGDANGGEVKVGTPTVAGAKVEAAILEQGRAPKVTVIKYKRKVRYKRKKGHRQEFTKVRIEKITPASEARNGLRFRSEDISDERRGIKG